MNFSQKAQEGQELVNKLVRKSRENPKFKSNLISDPISTIESFTDVKFNLPEGKTIRVEDQTDDRYIYLNLPFKPDLNSIELEDEELESISGGDFWLGVGASLVAAALWDMGNGYYDTMKKMM